MPSRLIVSAVHIDVGVQPVGVAPDGQMALLPDPAVIGWYRFGSSPGSGRGAVVLGGHVDSKQYGVGPLSRLRRLANGDSIVVLSSDGTRKRYLVQRVEDIAKKALPIDDLFDRDGQELLHIVTCGGPYDRNAGGYRDNLVVTASPA